MSNRCVPSLLDAASLRLVAQRIGEASHSQFAKAAPLQNKFKTTAVATEYCR